MATEERHGTSQQPLPAPKTTYRYSASSYTTKSNEEELFELVQLSGVPMDKELFKVILELLKLNIAPTAILQILKTIKSKVKPGDSMPSSAHSSRPHSPTLATPTAPPTQVSTAALHGIKSDQERSTREHRPTRTKSFKSAEKPGERTAKPSSRHRSSSLKHHKAPSTGTKIHSSNKT